MTSQENVVILRCYSSNLAYIFLHILALLILTTILIISTLQMREEVCDISHDAIMLPLW